MIAELLIHLISDHSYLFKTGTNLYDTDRFVPVLFYPGKQPAADGGNVTTCGYRRNVRQRQVHVFKPGRGFDVPADGEMLADGKNKIRRRYRKRS